MNRGSILGVARSSVRYSPCHATVHGRFSAVTVSPLLHMNVAEVTVPTDTSAGEVTSYVFDGNLRTRFCRHVRETVKKMAVLLSVCSAVVVAVNVPPGVEALAAMALPLRAEKAVSDSTEISANLTIRDMDMPFDCARGETILA